MENDFFVIWKSGPWLNSKDAQNIKYIKLTLLWFTFAVHSVVDLLVQYIEDLAAKEVIALGSPLAVSTKSRVESRTNCVPKESPEVKLWGQFCINWKFYSPSSCDIISVLEIFGRVGPKLNWSGASHCLLKRPWFSKTLLEEDTGVVELFLVVNMVRKETHKNA